MLRLVALFVSFVALLTACDGVEKTSWSLTDEPDGTTLHLVVEVAPCVPFDHINVTETNEDVTVTAYRRHENTGRACPQILLHEPHTVQLEAPLGERTLRGCMGAYVDCASSFR
jgi:hypothetical protein